ncbi:MAG: hypothetical protein C0591_13055 [Marinilabiliales bacterium]|nr:MAG: hypothetical protein C0591_13055 [Marinilabiliales bacterium]
MKKLVLFIIIGFIISTLYAQDTTSLSVEKNNKLFSIGFITGFNIDYIETWSVGLSLSGTFKNNIGPYLDFKIASYNEAETDVTPKTNTTSYIWHFGLAIAVNRLFRPYIAFGMKHNKYSFSGEQYTPWENSLNTAIGFNIGSKKSVVGFQGGVEIDSDYTSLNINGIAGVAGITINFW